MLVRDIPADLILFFMLYGGVALASLIACIYLCVRRGNSFAADVTPPVALRRWAAAFFAVAFAGHVWWYLFYIYSGDIHSAGCAVLEILDCVGILTTAAGMLFAMLQDRKRPLWPVIIATIPFAIFEVLHMVHPEGRFIDMATAYILLFYVLFSVYMVFAVRQYGRWLRDNYADLEHKEVWQSHALVIALLLLIVTYGFDSGDLTIGFLVQLIGLVLIGFLLWRIETLPQLTETAFAEQAIAPSPAEEARETTARETHLPTHEKKTFTIPSNIEQLLEERCVGTRLYLQHDLTIQQVAQAIGINRFYLSQYFSSHGTTYNAYINNLRINHFVSLYRETVQTNQSIVAQQLASDSGYRSYSTFSLAFKQRMGKSVTAWMRNTAKE